MAKKKKESNVDEIKKNLEKGNLIFGTQMTMKSLKLGNVEKVFVTKNCPAEVKKDVMSYSNIGKFEVVELESTNEELGVICKKPFSISVIGLLRG